MAQILYTAIICAVIVKYGSLAVKNLSSGPYTGKSYSAQGVFETNKRLANSKNVESIGDFPCNIDECHSTENSLPVAHDHAGTQKPEKTTNQRNKESEILPKQPLNEENQDNPPRLPRIDPIEVGYVRELKLVPGKVHKMKTLSLRPALFEIEDFLSEEECNDIILMAQTQGLERSMTLGEVVRVGEDNNANKTAERNVPQDPAETFLALDTNVDGHLDTGEIGRGLMELGRVLIDEADANKMMDDLNMDPNKDGVITYHEFVKLVSENKLKDIVHYLEKVHKTKPNKRTRDSSTAFLDPYEHIDFKPLFESLRDRIHLVTQLPKDMIWSSENMQVIRYHEKQHYHCHYDSEDEDEKNLPCCHQVENLSDEYYEIECVPCRFLTFFYYLKEPTLGGETAFPIADNKTIPENETIIQGEMNKCDLSEHCYDANLYYKPKRGAALLWYNHLVSEETGWLGPMDIMSYHGGCDVIEGTKWAANNWINAGSDRETDLKVWKVSRLVEEDFQERMRRHPWEEETHGHEEERDGGNQQEQ